jgi:hypothetical protein
MLANVFDMLFGCGHRRYTFPITAKKGSRNLSPAARVTGTYVACLDCGREFPYDWNQMKVLSANYQAPETAPLTPEPVAGFGKAA